MDESNSDENIDFSLDIASNGCSTAESTANINNSHAANHMEDLENQKEAASSEAETNVSDILATVSSLTKQGDHNAALDRCEKALLLLPKNDKILEKKIKVLCQMGSIQGAFTVASEWLQREPENPIAKKELKRLQTVMAVLQDQFQESDDEDSKDTNISSSKSREHASPAPNTVEPETVKPVPRNTVRVLPPQPSPGAPKQNIDLVQNFFCSFCDLHFGRQEELDNHCHSDLHKKHLASDESHDWHFRPPPRGQTSDEYTLCQRFLETTRCPFGDKCTQAHSEAELEEWKERFTFRTQQLQKARDNQLHGNTFTEQLLERLTDPDGPKAALVQNLEFVKIHANSDLKVNMTTKKCTSAWTFTVTSKLCLHCVALLDDGNRAYFHISSISVGPKKTQKYQNLETHCQEWINPDTSSKGQGEYVFRIKIVFKTDIYGTFRQSVIFNFGLDAVVAREVQVESAPSTDPEKLSKDLVLLAASRWTRNNVTVIPFTPPSNAYSEKEEQLLLKYVLPPPDRLSLSETLAQSLSKENYRLWMHEMLYLEEMAEFSFIQRFNVTASLQLVNRFLLMPGSLSSAKYAREGELFARLRFEDVISEDSSAGRLILQNSQMAWIAPVSSDSTENANPKKVFEAVIEDKGKNFVFLRLSNICVSELNLTCDECFNAQIQFQLNRLPKCEMHAAVDSLSTLSIVFPKVADGTIDTPSVEEEVLTNLKDMLLNAQQKEAVLNIITPSVTNQPPLLIIGPFGTGKTYTIAQAAKLVLQQKDTRILICTHSNSAADLYIKDFLHPYVEEGHAEARPLRVYYHYRWVQTVPEVILPYSLLQREGEAAGTFGIPTLEDVMKHRVVITTLSTARYISDIELPQGHFTHIFIDEAAQSLECETLIPISLANENTHIVLAGDHMQISPEVYSDFTKQQGFHISLLERLYDLYPNTCFCKVMLCENYRSHAAIVEFTSELFYDNQLIASGKQAAHPILYPLTFYAARGEEVQHENSTGYYNLSEMYEIVDRVDELRKKWPEDWGDIDNNGISVVAPYMDQVIRIRGELRKKKIYNVSVERVLNVQGKQYRVIIISVVRTRRTCRSDSSAEDYIDYGFLSNVKLLNTAITRAQSLVLVVADPVSLCLVGKCRKVWEHFLEVCQQNSSLFGITYAQLRSQLDRAEVAKNYVLNPLAPEFVPNRLFHVTRQASEAAAAAAAAGYLQHPASWPYNMGHHVSANPYQMYPPQMVPFYPMNPYPNYMSSVFVRPSGGPGFFRRGFPRSSLHHQAEMQRSEGIRMFDLPSVRPFKQRRAAMYMHRMPVVYPPMYPMYPSHHSSYPGYYFLPDDPRVAAMQHAYPFSHHFQHPQIRHSVNSAHTHFHGSAIHPLLHTPQHQMVQGKVGSADPLEESQEAKNPSDSKEGGSNTSAPAFKMLPNVKHVPLHLLGNHATSSQNSSRSSTPVSQTSTIPGQSPVLGHVREGRSTPVSERPYSPANYPTERSSPPQSDDDTGHDHSGSLETDQITSEVFNSSSSVEKTVDSSTENAISTQVSLPSSKRAAIKPPRLQSTGFSRQFSDDLPTPSAISDIVRMIEENTSIDERSEGDERSAIISQSPFVSRVNGRNAALSSLQLDLASVQTRQTVGSNSLSTSSPSSSGSQTDDRLSYASIVQKSPSPSSMLVPDISQMEPQTPRTPSGFITPGVDVDLDPFGILKSLNIEATTTDHARRQDSSSLL